MNCKAWALLTGVTLFLVPSAYGATMTNAEFIGRCREAWSQLKDVPDSPGRVASRRLLATQDVFNPRKIGKATADDESIDIITWQGHHFIIDGHHRGLNSILLVEDSVPVHQIADLSHLNWLDFVSVMHEMGYMMHLRDGRPFAHPCEMYRELNLQLARLITERIEIEPRLRQVRVLRTAQHRLITKIGRGKPHQEAYLAKRARALGIEYQEEWEKYGLPTDVIQTLSAILQDPFFQHDPRVIVHTCSDRLDHLLSQ